MLEQVVGQEGQKPIENIDQFVDRFMDEAKGALSDKFGPYEVAFDLMGDSITDAVSNLTDEERAAFVSDAEERFPDYRYSDDGSDLSWGDIESRIQEEQAHPGQMDESGPFYSTLRDWAIGDLSQRVLRDRLDPAKPNQS